jgi:hypothetical protein
MIVTVATTIMKVFAIVCEMRYMKGVETIGADIVASRSSPRGPLLFAPSGAKP